MPVEFVSSVPADVVRRRPDIRAAERRLAAQTAQVGVATAALYPSLSLSGSIGVTASNGSDLLSDGLQSNRIGIGVNVPVFRGGALRQNIKAQNALVDAALAGYEETVLEVYEEVENGLNQWVNEQARHAALLDSAGSARLARDLAVAQYNSGLVDFQTVLTAERQLISAEDALAVSDGEVASNLIRLYKAFGGGWSVFPASSTAVAGTP
jgi:outer membrane protein TolC